MKRIKRSCSFLCCALQLDQAKHVNNTPSEGEEENKRRKMLKMDIGHRCEYCAYFYPVSVLFGSFIESQFYWRSPQFNWECFPFFFCTRKRLLNGGENDEFHLIIWHRHSSCMKYSFNEWITLTTLSRSPNGDPGSLVSEYNSRKCTLLCRSHLSQPRSRPID